MSPTASDRPGPGPTPPAPAAPAYLDAATLARLIDAPRAVDVLARALAAGEVDPEDDTPRLFAPARAGAEFLMMPSAGRSTAGVKVLTLTPGNPRAGHPTVQGLYILFDADTMAPVALVEAAELTLIRTSATTVMAARHLLAAKRHPAGEAPERPTTDLPTATARRVVVFGTGPQARRHISCLTAVLAPEDIAVAGRRPEAVEAVAAQARADGAPARPARGDVAAEVAAADLVICVTSSPTPLFDGAAVADDAVVCAVGVHGPGKRELPADLILRSDLVVEGRASAMRESGNLLAARTAQQWAEDPRPLANLADLAAGRFTPRPGCPAVFSGVGMAWEDLVLVTHAHHQYRRSRPAP
ncbi:ornithine cyclodeaminase family protein [Nocardiopsis sediminis]|uniref:Ornithine cyclodeaminase family protein n=1 Tax=Nocardiopsis sediminis TaxID=1778267 RepID=A0ABV8FN86_9ACTN